MKMTSEEAERIAMSMTPDEHEKLERFLEEADEKHEDYIERSNRLFNPFLRLFLFVLATIVGIGVWEVVKGFFL